MSKTGHEFDVYRENYVKAIWNLSQTHKTQKGIVKNSQIAKILLVSRPTVTQMLKKIVQDGILLFEGHGSVKLTKKGKILALQVIRKHRLIELFLKQTLGLDKMELHQEAELLEHAISDNLLEKIDAYLGHPKSDSTGMPIPSLGDAQFEDHDDEFISLPQVNIGRWATISSLPDYDPSALEVLFQRGLKIGMKFQLEEVFEPDFVRIKIRNPKKEITLPLKYAAMVGVTTN